MPRYIDADALIEHMKKDPLFDLVERYGVSGVIESFPTADVVERKKGKWIPSFDRWGDIVTTVDGYTCSECGSFNTDKDNFCPNCGAEMKGEEE